MPSFFPVCPLTCMGRISYTCKSFAACTGTSAKIFILCDINHLSFVKFNPIDISFLAVFACGVLKLYIPTKVQLQYANTRFVGKT